MKKLVKLESDEDQADLDIAKRDMPDSRAKRIVRKNIARLHGHLVDNLGTIVGQVENKDITVDAAATAAIVVMTTVFDAAIRQGYIVAGLPNWEITKRQGKVLEQFLTTEIEYFTRFLLTLESVSSRVAMYGGAADAVFGMGMISGLPSTAQIHWRLGVAEHCSSCLSLAAGGPYSKPGHGSHPLPTVPRGNWTKCLRNCRCHLIVEGGIKASLINQIGIEVIAIGAMAINPTEPAAKAASNMYQGLIEDYAYLRRRAFLEPDGAWAGMAAAILVQIDGMAEGLNHTIRLEANEDEILEPVRSARRLGMEYRSEVDSDLVGIFVAILVDDTVEHGRITSVDASGIVLDDDPQRRYRLDRQGRAFLFVESRR